VDGAWQLLVATGPILRRQTEVPMGPQTGWTSIPHIVSCRERIRDELNGQSLLAKESLLGSQQPLCRQDFSWQQGDRCPSVWKLWPRIRVAGPLSFCCPFSLSFPLSDFVALFDGALLYAYWRKNGAPICSCVSHNGVYGWYVGG